MFRSISTVKGDLAQTEFKIDGKEIVWAILSTGINSSHLHFQLFDNLRLPNGLRHLDYSNIEPGTAKSRKIIWSHAGQSQVDYLSLSKTVTKPVDAHGNGTEVAGIMVGQSTDEESDQLLKGLIPKCKLLSIKVLDESGSGNELASIAGLRAIQQINANSQNLRVHGVLIALSFGWDRANFACGQSPVCAEIDRLVNSGVVVVVPSGNRSYKDHEWGADGGIADPGNAELAITVGATHKIAPQIYGVSYFSKRGPTDDGRAKPDLVAPGSKIVVCTKGNGSPHRVMDGTSYAAAHAAGAAAAILSVQPALIGKPREVKSLLQSTAVDLGRDKMYQGAGFLDVLSAVRKAVGNSQPIQAQKKPVKIFCSYSHKDKSLWMELKAHLSFMERAGRIEVWSDQLIEPGQAWENAIFEHLNSAEVVLLLVSAFFFESNFCYTREMTNALERHDQGKTRVVPIRVRPANANGTPLERIQALPPEGKPITSFPDPHDGWTQVTEKLYGLVLSLRE
jgi:subtilisin family serine protease